MSQVSACLKKSRELRKRSSRIVIICISSAYGVRILFHNFCKSSLNQRKRKKGIPPLKKKVAVTENINQINYFLP